MKIFSSFACQNNYLYNLYSYLYDYLSMTLLMMAMHTGMNERLARIGPNSNHDPRLTQARVFLDAIALDPMNPGTLPQWHLRISVEIYREQGKTRHGRWHQSHRLRLF